MKSITLSATRLLRNFCRRILPKKQRYRPELHYMRGKPSGLAPRRPPSEEF